VAAQVEGLEDVGKSMTTKDNLSSGDIRCLLDVFIGEINILLDTRVNNVLGDQECLMCMNTSVHNLGIFWINGILCYQFLSLSSDVVPI
jgi:hypothetical protein